MKHFSTIAFTLILFTAMISCNRPKQLGDLSLTVFDHELVQFIPEKYFNKELNEEGGIIRIGNGRILLKKTHIPDFERTTRVTANITLASAGDRWDKSGSFFILPQESVSNLLKIAGNQQEFPLYPHDDEPHGIVRSEMYLPTLELIRFMTPFGVGAYSDSVNFRHRKPVYIPFWEKEVNWEQDITHLISALEGEVWIGIWIDTWTKEGYVVDASLHFDESHLKCDAQKTTRVEPLVNTVPYIIPLKMIDIFAQKNLETTINTPRGAKNVKLYYIVTGHGGHSGGDEFTKQENIISIDGKIIHRFTPWRDDCATFRRFNPGSGVWLVKDTAQYIDQETWTYKEKEIEERIASSDFSRSNWCPGSDVDPVVIPLENLKAGEHTITISIPGAQPMEDDKMNLWLISAYLVWDE